MSELLGVEARASHPNKYYASVYFTQKQHDALTAYIEKRKRMISKNQRISKHSFIRAVVLEAIGYKGEE